MEEGKAVWPVKGVLVFFADSDKAYLRKSVVWRWIEHHLKAVNDSNVHLLHESFDKINLSKSEIASVQLTLPVLLRHMLRWFKALVDGEESKLDEPNPPFRNSEDLEILLKAVQQTYERKVQIKLNVSFPLRLHNHGDDLFAIIVALVINAVEATLRRPAESQYPPVTVNLDTKKNLLVVTVSDQAAHVSKEEVQKMERLETLNKQDGLPGGGLFLAKRLALHLASSTRGNDDSPVAPRIFEIRLQNPPPGVRVIVRLPLSAFQIPKVKEDLGDDGLVGELFDRPA